MVSISRFLMKITAFAAAASLAVSAAPICCATSTEIRKVFEFDTSECEDSKISFSLSGDYINAEGFFEGESVSDVSLTNTGTDTGAVTLRIAGDGSFSVNANSVPETDGGDFVVKFNSGRYVKYHLLYDDGWFIYDYGTAMDGYEILNNCTIVSDKAALGYVDAALDENEYSTTLDKIDEIVAAETQNCGDDYQKARAISRWISSNIYYDHDAEANDVTLDTVALDTVLRLRRTTCAGFANLFCAMCESVNITALTVIGSAVSSSSVFSEDGDDEYHYHEWCAFYDENEDRWVYADPCWDCLNSYRDGEYQNNGYTIKYFDISPLALSQNHRLSSAELRLYYAANSYYMQFGSFEFSDDVPPAIEQAQSETEKTEKPEKPEVAETNETKENIRDEKNEKSDADANTTAAIIETVEGEQKKLPGDADKFWVYFFIVCALPLISGTLFRIYFSSKRKK